VITKERRKEMPRLQKGDKRDPQDIARTVVSQLETGWRRMLARHAEELTMQQAKIEAAKAKLAKLEAEKQKDGIGN
jgi:hypothetical protein